MSFAAPPVRRLWKGADVNPKVTTLDRFWAKIKVGAPDECWEWQAATHSRGYGYFGIGHGQNITASRFAWELGNAEQIPEGMWVLHSCDNPPCCNPAHLHLGTRADNMREMVERQRHWAHRGLDFAHKGEKNGRAKLTEQDVVAIRDLHAKTRMPYSKIAPYFGVTRGIIRKVCERRSWKHVP